MKSGSGRQSPTMATPKTPRFEGFVTTPSGLREMDMDSRVQALEGKFGLIRSIEEKLDKVIEENAAFKREIYVLTKENHDLLRAKVEIEKENLLLKKECDEMKKKIIEMEKKITEGDIGKKECLNLIDSKMKEVRNENQEVQKSFREIMRKQEEENKVISQKDMVKALKENEYVVRDIAEKKSA